MNPPDLTHNPLLAAARLQQPHGPQSVVSYGMPMPKGARRTIGPIPPRGKDGRLLLKDRLDADGKPIPRDTREHLAYEPGQEPAEGSTKGLKLFQVDLLPEPVALVYAKDAEHAVKVYQAEMGITRFGEFDPQVTEVKS